MNTINNICDKCAVTTPLPCLDCKHFYKNKDKPCFCGSNFKPKDRKD